MNDNLFTRVRALKKASDSDKNDSAIALINAHIGEGSLPRRDRPLTPTCLVGGAENRQHAVVMTAARYTDHVGDRYSFGVASRSDGFLPAGSGRKLDRRPVGQTGRNIHQTYAADAQPRRDGKRAVLPKLNRERSLESRSRPDLCQFSDLRSERSISYICMSPRRSS